MDQDQKNQFHHRMGHHRFWGVVIFIIIIVALFGFFGHHHNDYGDNQNNLHTISVAGHGEVFATSTVATFSFTASDRETTVADAQNKMAVKANAAVDYLKQNGVAAADIQTTDYSVNPTYSNTASPAIVCAPGYGSCGGGTPTINGYEVSETLSVKLRDPSKSGSILQGVGSAGVSNISGLSFTIDKPEALQEEARKMAIDEAKAKAKQLAKDLGIRLDDIISFNESGNNPGPIPYYAKSSLDSAAGTAAVAPAPDIQTGQNKITSDVTITYEIK